MGRLSSTTTLIAAVVSTAVACGRDGARNMTTASGPYSVRVAKAIPQIEKATGLTFKTPPKIERRSKDEVRGFLEKKFNEDTPQKELAGMQRAYRRFGLLPDSLDLHTYLLELLTEQVVGYYDPATKVLYIVDGAPAEQVDVTISHELVHALQDQYFNLDSLQKIEGNNDRSTAAQSVVEGQATYEQLQSMLGANSVATQLPGGWDRIRDMIREQQSAMPVFASAPLLLQETLIFPYLSGAEFMRRYETKYPGQVPYKSMPVSTEQIMHEAAYFAGPDEPTQVTLPAVPNTVYENNLGEFETRLFLFQHLQDQAPAVRAAAGWDGDRYVLFTTNGGDALAWVTVWDSAVDSGEFFDVLDTSILKRLRNPKPVTANQSSRTYSANGRTIAITAAEIAGRPAVLYVDVPAGARTNVIDLSKVQLQE